MVAANVGCWLALMPALVLSGRSAAAGTSGPPSAFQVGINLDGLSDYTPQSSFVDAIKQSRHWGSPGTPWDEAAPVDTNGWPTQDAGLVVLCCIGDSKGNSLLAGTYALSFQGQAVLGLVATSGSIGGQSYDAVTNTTTAAITINPGATGSLLALSFTSTRRNPADAPGDGVTDVHLIRPHLAPNGQPWWQDPKQTFTTPFLKLLQPYAVLRAMGFTNTNGNPQVNWADRTHKNSATQQTPGGVSWDYVIELANTLKKDVWINIPDQATDAYVASLAQQMTQLDPAMHLYLEYSNEVWNYSFAQAARNQAAAEAEVAANPNSPLAWNCTDIGSCRYEWGARRVGERAVQIAGIFQRAFGNRAGQLRPIYATQLGQTYFVSLVLPMIAQFFGEPSSLLYGIAQAPYWSGDNSMDKLTARQELANAAANLATLPAAEQGFAAWARYYGLQSVTYEGGPGMSGTASLNAKIIANRSAAMGAQVTQAIAGAASEGVSLYTYFDDAGQYGQYGMWGATEDVFDRHTPKIAALGQLIKQGTAPLQGGLLLPQSFSPVAPDLTFGNFFTEQNPAYLYLRQGGLAGYLVDVPVTGTYAVTLTVGTYYGATTAALAADRAPLATVAVPDTGGNIFTWTNTTPTNVTLAAGLHVLSVSSPSGEFAMNQLSVATGTNASSSRQRLFAPPR